jgi:hypothetical protein
MLSVRQWPQAVGLSIFLIFFRFFGQAKPDRLLACLNFGCFCK